MPKVFRLHQACALNLRQVARSILVIRLPLPFAPNSSAFGFAIVVLKRIKLSVAHNIGTADAIAAPVSDNEVEHDKNIEDIGKEVIEESDGKINEQHIRRTQYGCMYVCVPSRYACMHAMYGCHVILVM